MKKIFVYSLALSMALSTAACHAPAGESGLSVQESSSTVSSEAAQSQDSPNNQENQALGAAFRIDTEKQLVWDEGFDAERSLLTRYEYDQSGRLLRTVPEGGDSYSINCYEYDEDGNLAREYDSD